MRGGSQAGLPILQRLVNHQVIKQELISLETTQE